MLGLLRPHPGHLDAEAHARYRQLYCGLCASLGREHGQLYRMIHTYDGVFVALVADGLGDPAPVESVRCPLAPHRFRAATAPGGAALRYAASVQVLAMEQRFADDAAEGSRLAAGVHQLIAPRVNRWVSACEEAAGPGEPLPPTVIRALGRTQSAVEATWPMPGEAAAPTAAATADIFAQLAPLSDVCDAPGTSADVDAVVAVVLERFGAALGEVIYLVDALEDLRGDHHNGRFNPCISDDGALDPDRTEAACVALEAAHIALVSALSALPLRRNRDVAESIVDTELAHRIATCTRKAREWVGARRMALERRAGLGVFGLAADRMLVASVMLWVLFSGAASAGRASPVPMRRINHFCHPDCVSPSTYCAAGYPHDGHFAMDDCVSRWTRGVDNRAGAVDDVGSAWDVVCPSDTSSYCFGECACCTDSDAGETTRGCCCDYPGWCSDMTGLVSWVTGMFAMAWMTAELRVDEGGWGA
jgi:hypothetical protein